MHEEEFVGLGSKQYSSPRIMRILSACLKANLILHMLKNKNASPC